MFVITNRIVREEKSGLHAFGNEPNPSGPNELRLVEVDRVGGNFNVKVLKDKLSKAEAKALSDKHNLNLDLGQDWYASLRVACTLFEHATRQNRHLLVFVHGYNNDMEDVLKTSEALENLYNVLVIPFSWPANGGGKVSGTASYLSDKDDARNKGVAREHSYFKGKPVQVNATLLKIFRRLFEGGKVEESLTYFPDLNVYRS